MRTSITTRLFGLAAALVLTVAINGGLLLKFDQVAQQATAASATTAVVKLEPVTVVGKRV